MSCSNLWHVLCATYLKASESESCPSKGLLISCVSALTLLPLCVLGSAAWDTCMLLPSCFLQLFLRAH